MLVYKREQKLQLFHFLNVHIVVLSLLGAGNCSSSLADGLPEALSFLYCNDSQPV